MARKLADLGLQNFSWQTVKGFLHLFNLADHLFALIVLAVLVPLRFYWKRVKDADSQRCSSGPITISMIYDSIRISTGRVDAAYDYLRKLDQSLNSIQESRSQVRLVPENILSENALPENVSSARVSSARVSSARVSSARVSTDWKLRNALKRAKEITKTAPRIVHIHYTVGAYKGGLAIYFVPFLIRFFHPRPKVVITYHQFTEHKPNSFLFRSLFLLLCLSADGYIFLRNDHSRAFVWGETFLNKNFTFIPSPSNLEFEESGMDGRHPKSIPQSVPHPMANLPHYPMADHYPMSNLSHFGTIRQGKGLEILIRAFGIVHEKYPGIKLILAGAIDGAYHQKLMKRIASYNLTDYNRNLTDSILFTGQLDPDALYDTLLGTIVVLPFPDGASTYRSSLMAALSMGLPVITSRGKYTPEMFKDGENMFLAKCGSFEDLAAVIDRVMSRQAGYRQKVGLEGCKLYDRSFSWQNCLRKHLAFYRKIL